MRSSFTRTLPLDQMNRRNMRRDDRDWWREAMLLRLPVCRAGPLTEVFRYDGLTRPIFDEPGAVPPGPQVVDVAGALLPTRLVLYYKALPPHYGEHEQGVYFVGRTGENCA